MRNYYGLGAWSFDPSRLVLSHRDMPSYEVYVEQIRGSRDLLDWVFHLRHKHWVSPVDIVELLDLMDDLVDAREALAGNKGVFPVGTWDRVRGLS